MNDASLKQLFYRLVAPSLPNEWDVEEALEGLSGADEQLVTAFLEQVPMIWPVSHSLCFLCISQGEKIGAHLKPEMISPWFKGVLDNYERHGLRGAQQFIDDVPNFMACVQGRRGLLLEEAQGRLQPYVNGLAGREVPLLPGEQLFTDTCSIFLPRALRIRGSSEEGFLIYKFMVSFQWGIIALGTLAIKGHEQGAAQSHPLKRFFADFPESETGRGLYYFFETVRVLSYLQQELPGLIRQISPLSRQLFGREPAGAFSPPELLFERCWQGRSQLAGPDHASLLSLVKGWCLRCQEPQANRSLSMTAAVEVYGGLEQCGRLPLVWEPLLFQGAIQLEAVCRAALKQRQERHELFVASLSSHLLQLPPRAADDADTSGEEEQEQEQRSPAPGQSDQAMIFEQRSTGEHPGQRLLSITIDNQEVELNAELSELAGAISEDLGELPKTYISSAVGKAGRSRGAPDLHPDEEGPEIKAPLVYDEWDYRRQGYRKNWCLLREKEIPAVTSSFMAETLTKYRGQILQLRRQFELMQTRERFVRRQRDGDEIDFDALVETLADSAAGYPPSDRLFIRLQRDQREIAVILLVDMSNSTQGWVGKSIKEALVLLSEAMEMLNDRYAIYGFSGMRRLRCEVYPLKTLDEAYSSTVRKRIGSISPREYTRMAPAIRHMISLLKPVEARLRLLLILSDGKPEDYDDYKGSYAIEDTRHALFEAKAAGIQSFGITIDRHAQSYMGHMYGPANCIFVDDINRLPALVPEIYRTLTS
ncbi:nitric oxide reductase activation protein NorD [Desulfogranum mediterraneum]|uniref:nitric oxide reductase activation protein NorD n=1 Tax=Desulfogranum mediterraneum TaxID=160661 RepID=UPI0003FB4BC7|nr:hypothetical protein [Desulfogranum mediterraneum]